MTHDDDDDDDDDEYCHRLQLTSGLTGYMISDCRVTDYRTNGLWDYQANG